MLRIGGGYASPEDLQIGLINRSPRPEQLEVNDYVDLIEGTVGPAGDRGDVRMSFADGVWRVDAHAIAV